MVDFTCPNCGGKVSVNMKGRPRKNIPLTKVCETLQACKAIKPAAEELGCSEGYIYNLLKVQGLKVKEVINDNRQSSSQN